MFSFDPYSPAVDADPFPFYRRLRDEYPCFWSAEANMWVLSRYVDLVTALNDWRTFSSAKGNLQSLDEPIRIAARELAESLAGKVIAERRRNPQDDLISQFSMAEIDGDKLDEREVLLTTTTLNLADHPEARRQCVANPELLVDAIEEFHKVVPEYRRVQEQLSWMPSSTFRSPLRLDLARA